MASMSDRDIKTTLERLAWLSSLMLTADMRNSMIAQSQGAVAPGPSFIAVMEAFFILQVSIVIEIIILISV